VHAPQQERDRAGEIDESEGRVHHRSSLLDRARGAANFGTGGISCIGR
jgi:hypothetical protein